MIEKIGQTAGEVWQLLNRNGETTVAKLRTGTKSDAFTVNAAIGWLAREDKVVISKSGNSVKVALK